MSRSSIPVDLRNPGQVFACLGLMEAAEILFGPCEGHFCYTTDEVSTRFEFGVAGVESSVGRLVQCLANADVVALAPADSSLTTKPWGVSTEPGGNGVFPSPLPDSPATLPVRLRINGLEIPVEHWADGEHCGRDNQKFWAGAGGYPGAALARDAVEAISSLRSEEKQLAGSDPFSVWAPMASSFRLDWRRDYIPLDAGFSPNKQGSISMVGFPIVELLAAIGLQHARPKRANSRNKLSYRYHVSNLHLPTALVRAILGSDQEIIPKRTFVMKLGWPGQEGQARCIIDAEEKFS